MEAEVVPAAMVDEVDTAVTVATAVTVVAVDMAVMVEMEVTAVKETVPMASLQDALEKVEMGRVVETRGSEGPAGRTDAQQQLDLAVGRGRYPDADNLYADEWDPRLHGLCWNCGSCARSLHGSGKIDQPSQLGTRGQRPSRPRDRSVGLGAL